MIILKVKILIGAKWLSQLSHAIIINQHQKTRKIDIMKCNVIKYGVKCYPGINFGGPSLSVCPAIFAKTENLWNE